MPILSVEDLCSNDNKCFKSIRRVFRVEYNRTNGIDKRSRVLISSDNKVVSSGWSFISAVLGQMTYPVASSTLDSARSYMMHGAPFIQGTVSSIPIGGSVSPEGFLSSILLLVVIIVTVLIFAVILVVVVITIVGVVIVVVFIGIVIVVGGVSSIFKLSFMIIGDPVGLFYSNRLGVCIPPGQDIIGVSLGLVFLSVFAMLAACASRAASMLLAISCWMAAKVMAGVSDTSRDKCGDNGMSDLIEGLVFKGLRKSDDRRIIVIQNKASDSLDSSGTGSSPNGRVDLIGDEDPTDEDRDIRNDDSTGVLVSLGDEISLGGKKF
ncbi:hypothetical protein Tco_1523724 [Tanacetum coccineum]